MSEWANHSVSERVNKRKWMTGEWVSAWLNVPGWTIVFKRVITLNEPPYEYWGKQEFLAQRRPTNWIHLSPFAVREMRYSSLRPLALYLSASQQSCSSLPPTSDTNTTLSHNGTDYHDNCNNGSAWDKRVCGTPGQLKYLRDCRVEKRKNNLRVFVLGAAA